MNKLLLVTALIAVCFTSDAQNFQHIMPENQANPVKLKDVIDAYNINKAQGVYEEDESGKEKEGTDYHFNRWVWYMSNHLDNDGYIISPVKNYEEWLKYNNKQSRNKTTAVTNVSNWAFQGPTTSTGGYAGIGRINSIAFHPTDQNQIWIASAGGGAWRTLNNGLTWASMTHMLPVLGTSDIDIHPTNPNIIYMCTGDKESSDTYSIGVMKSTNGGTTWDTTGLKWTVTQNRLTNSLVINKANPNTLLVATSNGIYRSTNAGVTFVQEKTGNYKEIVYHPTDSNILYATGSALVSRSADGGNNWTDITGFTGKGRIAVAVTPANVSIVKLVVSNTSNGLDGIYNSTDTGKTYTRIYQATGSGCTGNILVGANSGNGCGGQGWYDLCIAINPNNANEVNVGGVNTWYSTNGGTSWTISTNWYSVSGIATVHADKHFMAYHPLVSGRLYQGNDGGIYRTDNPMNKNSIWTDMTNGLGITQFYRNAVSHTADQFVLAGAQDNGTKALKNGTWTDPNGGDGMDCQIDYTDSTIYYTATQNGDLDRHAPSPLGNDQISDNIPGKPNGPWITPYIITPQNPTHLVAGFQKIYHTADYGATWDSVTSARLDPSQDVLRVAMTPASATTIYALVNSSSKIYYTHTWTPGLTATFNSYTPPYSGNLSDIVIDHKNKDHFWVTFKGYGSGQVAEYNAGTWTKINTNLPDVPVNCITVDTSNYFMYIGTDIGVFYFDTTSHQWEAYNNSNAMPSIEVTDLSIHYKKKALWASTYGRGLWKSQLQYYGKPPDTGNFVQLFPFANNIQRVFPNPSNGVFTVTVDAAMFGNMPVECKIIDLAGKTVWANKQQSDADGDLTIHTQGLANGFYILDLYSDKEHIGRQKITIE